VVRLKYHKNNNKDSLELSSRKSKSSRKKEEGFWKETAKVDSIRKVGMRNNLPGDF
jgi:hypothetical protein